MIRVLFLLSFLLFSVSYANVEDNIKTFTLSNGLQFIVIENNRMPVVNHFIFYRVGAIDEVQGKTGLAHFFEHLMFKGTKLNPDDTYTKTLSEFGASFNAYTTNDHTAYHVTASKNALSTIMRLEADRMRGVLFKTESVEKERSVVIEERKMRIDNAPEGLFFEQFEGRFYMEHPYQNPVIGWKDQIGKWKIEDIKDFYNTYYYPNNAIVVVSGDVNYKDVEKLAYRHYGDIKKSTKNIERIDIIEDSNLLNSSFSMSSELAKVSIYTRYYQFKGHRQLMIDNKLHDLYVMDMLVELLGGSDTSYLWNKLVDEKQILTSISVSYNSVLYGPAPIVITATPTDGISIDVVKDSINKEIENFINSGITDKDIDRVKKSVVKQKKFIMDNANSYGHMVGYLLIQGYSLEEIKTLNTMYDNVTKAEVQNLAKSIFATKYADGYLEKRREK